MSKFFDIDDWETVDMASTGVGLAAGAAAPLTIGFSLFMAGECSSPTEEPEKKAAPGATKKSGPKNIFAEGPKPTWAY